MRCCFKNIIFQVLLTIVFSTISFGQNTTDTTKINSLIAKAKTFLNENEYGQALQVINQAERVSVESNWELGLLKVFATKSSIQNIYNKHYEAISTGRKGLQLAQKLKNGYYEVLFYRSLANNHDMLDNYKEAIPYYNKCLASSEKRLESKLIRGHCYVEIGDAYRLFYQKPQEAVSLIQKGIEIYQEVDTTALGYAYDYLGEAFTDLGQFKEAKKNFEKSEAYYLLNNDQYLMPELLFHKAKMFLIQKDYANAIKTAQEALSYSKTYNTIYSESEASKILYQAYKEMGNNDLALRYYETYTVLHDSLTKANIDNRFVQIENEIQLKNQENRINELSLQKQKIELRNQRLLLGALLLISILLLFFIFYFRKQSKILKSKNAKISEALLIGQSSERQRIAQELRDSLGSNLSSISWTLDLLKTDSLNTSQQQLLSSLKQLLDQTYEEINLLSKHLTPEDLKKIGFENALRNLVRKTNKSAKANYQISVINWPNGGSDIVSFEVYNICMELLFLNNKLNKSKSGLLGISKAGPVLELNFTANDEGQLTSEFPNGFKNILLRVESIKGKLSQQLNDQGKSAFSLQFKS